MSSSIAEDLSSFIGNYFYDDSYFILELVGKEWKAKTDNYHGKQDVVSLIVAAEHNTLLLLEKQARWEERKAKMSNDKNLKTRS